jgi:hypothetical protein
MGFAILYREFMLSGLKKGKHFVRLRVSAVVYWLCVLITIVFFTNTIGVGTERIDLSEKLYWDLFGVGLFYFFFRLVYIEFIDHHSYLALEGGILCQMRRGICFQVK